MESNKHKVIAVDLDATLAKREEPFNPYSVGEPVPEMMAKVRKARDEGHKVVLFTARASSNDPGMHRAVREWLAKHDLGDMRVTCQKTPDIDEIWDDRARGVVPNEGNFTDDKNVTKVSSSEHHCERNTCPRCNGVSTCRCSKPKRIETTHVCENCLDSEKVAKLMVRKTKLVEQHDDHCPHCDVQFREKFYPRPDHEQAKREGIDIMEADELCPNCKEIVDRPEMSDEDIDSSPWLDDAGKQKMRERRQRIRDRIASRPKKVPLDELMDHARGSSKSSWDSACEDVRQMFKAAKAMPERLRNLWLRKGQCPKCGGMPESIHPDDAGDVECSKCHWLWELALAKTASDTTEKVPKPLKRFSRPENWDPYDKLGDVTLLCGCNDWECANTWLWAEGDGQRVWIELKFPRNHPCFEKYTDEDEKGWRAHAAAAKKSWMAAAKARKTKSDGYKIDSFAAALGDPSMEQFVAASGTDKLQVKEASTAVPTTGPHAIVRALQNLDLEALEAKARAQIASGKVTQRDAGVKMLNVLTGLKRNELHPTDLMITKVPVLPPAFRPFSLMGSTYIPGAANELYGDLFKHIDVHRETLDTLGDEGAAATRLNMRNAVRALYGYGDPVSPKLQQRGTQGFLHQITGSSPKFGYVMRRLVSKPIDSVGRSVITVAPDLDMNQIGIPRSMAWDLFGSLVQRKLARSGMGPSAAIKHVKDQSREATLALEQELKERPVIYSRAPAWHKFNTIAGYAQLHDGDDIRINPYVTAGHNADFDGDQINVNVPILDDSVKEAKEKLMPDKMLFSIKNPDEVMPNIKHESLLSLAAAAHRPVTQSHNFNSEAEALAAIQSGAVKLHDEINYPS